MKEIIVIAGPTGVGKSLLSVKLAELLDAEIINADAIQVYKGLNIGTAKINLKEISIPHHLIDFLEVTDNYSIYDYQRDARKKIREILESNKIVILVGGSALYIRALLYDYELEEEENDEDYDALDLTTLQELVRRENLDKDIDINNKRRLVRVLKTKEKKVDAKPIYDFTIIGLTTPREELYKIINNRVEQMFKEGLVEEVKNFYDKRINTRIMNTAIGYKELYRYFNNEISLEEAKELIKKNSRHYAKRQYTFFNNKFEVNWFNVNYNDFDETINEVYNFLKES